MNEKFVIICVTPSTREDLRFIAREKDTNLYKIVRDLAKNEKEKILTKTNASVN